MNQSDNKTWGGQNWEQPMNLSASCKNKPAKESPLAPKLWSPGPITALLPRRYSSRTTHNLTREKPEEGNEQNTYARAINALLNPQGLKTGYFACIHTWRCYSKVDVKSQRGWETPTTGRAGDGLVKTGGSLECSKSCTLAPSSHSRWIFWLRLICNFPHSYFTKGREKRNHLDLVSLEQDWEYPQCCWGSNKSQETPCPSPPSSRIRCISLITVQFSHLPLDSKFYKRAWLGSKVELRKASENHPSLLNTHARKSMCSRSSQPEHGNTSLP